MPQDSTTPSPAPPATRPAGSPIPGALADIAHVTFRPSSYWRKVAAAPASTTLEVLWPHAVLLGLIVALSTLIGDVTSSNPATSSVWRVVVHTFSTFVGFVLLVVAFGLATRAISAAKKGSATLARAMAFSAAAFSPVALIGLVNAIPTTGWVHFVAGLMAQAYLFVILGLGVHKALEIPESRGAEATGLLGASAMVLWLIYSGLTALPLAGAVATGAPALGLALP